MTYALKHRGPDAGGMWVDPEVSLALGHRRLAVVDLSAAGSQPMISESKRFVVTFNGEIYNHRALRTDLVRCGHRFEGRSDTETLASALEEWGVEGAARRLSGMFAFGCWDRRLRVLSLVRDRLGEKPLYVVAKNKVLAFASELRALKYAPAFSLAVDPQAIATYLEFNYFPEGTSVFANVEQVPAGSVVSVSWDRLANGEISDTACVPRTKYWDAAAKYNQALDNPFKAGRGEAVAELEERLSEILSAQMVADVPLGAFLSGGIDSSLIVAMMARKSGRPIQTFTVGYREADYDESRFAEAVARGLSTEHVTVNVEPNTALEVVKRIGSICDEPLADQSQVGTYLVAQAARQRVTVALTGDGGDELFGGYNRHQWGPRLWNWTRAVPRPLRSLVSTALGLLSADAWEQIAALGRNLAVRELSHSALAFKVRKVRECLNAEDPEELFLSTVRKWPAAGQLLAERADAYPLRLDRIGGALSTKMMFWDTRTYLQGDVLPKVDRAAMAVSLETRAPFLDHSLLEWSWRLPPAYTAGGRGGKWILRELLSRHLPREIFDRPKQGFDVPISRWLRGPLKNWGADLLDQAASRNDGLFDRRTIDELWSAHQSGAADMIYPLWNLLVFQAWANNNASAVPEAHADRFQDLVVAAAS